MRVWSINRLYGAEPGCVRSPPPHLIAQQAAFFLRYGLLPSIRRSTSGARSRAISDGRGGGAQDCGGVSNETAGVTGEVLSVYINSSPSPPFLCRLPPLTCRAYVAQCCQGQTRNVLALVVQVHLEVEEGYVGKGPGEREHQGRNKAMYWLLWFRFIWAGGGAGGVIKEQGRTATHLIE